MMNFANFFIEFSRGEMVKNTSHHMIAKDLQCYTGTLQGFLDLQSADSFQVNARQRAYLTSNHFTSL